MKLNIVKRKYKNLITLQNIDIKLTL